MLGGLDVCNAGDLIALPEEMFVMREDLSSFAGQMFVMREIKLPSLEKWS